MTTEISPITDFKNTLEKQAPQFKMALPPHISTERFTRTVMTAVQKNPKLLQCDRTSLWAACMQAASEGLMPNGIESAIVPFKDQAQFMPMVAGILKKIRNSGEIISICVEIVYEGEPFKYYVDTQGKHLEHTPNVFGLSVGPMLGAYAIAVSKDGGSYIEVMSAGEIGKVRSVSRSKDSGPWRDWFEEMVKKTVIRRLSKLLPMSTDVLDLIKSDDQFYQLEQPQITPPSTTPSKLMAAIKPEAKPVEGKSPI